MGGKGGQDQRKEALFRPTSGSSDSSSPDDHDKLGYTLVLVVHELDVLPAGDPKNWLALAVDSKDFALDPGGGEKDELEFAIAALVHELDAINRL